MEIAVIQAADGSVELVASITVADDAAADAAQTALGASFGDQASAAALLDKPGGEPTATPVVSPPGALVAAL